MCQMNKTEYGDVSVSLIICVYLHKYSFKVQN